MDPLSIASSAAGIAGLCIKVSGILYTFIDDARGVDDSVAGLCEEINGLQRALNAVGHSWKQNPLLATTQKTGDRDLWITVRGSLDDCQITLGKLDKRLVEVQKTSFLGRGFLRKPTMSIKLNMMMKDITAFRQQVHSHNSAMQSAFQMINVLLLLRSGSSQESMSRVLGDLKTQIGRVEVAVRSRNDSSEPPSSDVQEDNERISRNLRQFVRVAESFHSSASTVVGEGTIWGGSVYGDPLSDDQAQRIENWIPPPTIEEEGTEANESVSGTTEDVELEDSDPDSDMERDFVKNFNDLAISSFTAGDYPNAERFLCKVVSRSTDDLPGGVSKIRLMQAYAYGKQARWRDAENVLASLTTLKKVKEPLAYDGLHALALLKLQGDAHDAAIRYCKKALMGRRRLGGKESAPFHESMALLALIHERKGDMAEAEGCRGFLPAKYDVEVDAGFLQYLARPLRDLVHEDIVSDTTSAAGNFLVPSVQEPGNPLRSRLGLPPANSPLAESPGKRWDGTVHTPDSTSIRSTGPTSPPPRQPSPARSVQSQPARPGYKQPSSSLTPFGSSNPAQIQSRKPSSSTNPYLNPSSPHVRSPSASTPSSSPNPHINNPYNSHTRSPSATNTPSAVLSKNPVNPFEAGSTTSQALGGSSIEFLRSDPHFQQFCRVVQQQPHMLEPILQQTATVNPQLAKLIAANPEQFLQLLAEDIDEVAELPPGSHTISVTEEERVAIERLRGLGFELDPVIQAYFNFDKNEELAADFLLSQPNDPRPSTRPASHYSPGTASPNSSQLPSPIKSPIQWVTKNDRNASSNRPSPVSQVVAPAAMPWVTKNDGSTTSNQPASAPQIYQSSSAKSNAHLIIGIDFGATHSSVAFAYATDTEAREDIITEWPGAGLITKPRVPSSIYYDISSNVVGWGLDTADALGPNGQPKIGTTKAEWLHVYMQLEGGNPYLDAKSLPPLPAGKSAVDLVGDYLSRLREAALVALMKSLGPRIPNDASIVRYYFSHPPIWTEGAKTAFKKAIVQAGYVQDVHDPRVTLIPGPEASAHYCTRSGLLDSKNHDGILIVDCGKSFVDLVALEVRSNSPFKVRKCTGSSGDACGHTAVDRNFANILRSKVRKMKLPDGSKTAGRVYAKSIIEFDSRIRDDFRNNGQKWATDVGIERDYVEADIDDGYMTFTNEEILGCFTPVIERILELINNQVIAVQACNINLQYVLICGSFGANEYLFQQIKKRMPRNYCTVVRPMDSEATVVKGLVTAGLTDRLTNFSSDILPKASAYSQQSYYLSVADFFIPGVHPERFRMRCPDQDRCNNCVCIVLSAGAPLQSGHKIRIPTSKMVKFDHVDPFVLVDKLWAADANLTLDPSGKIYLFEDDRGLPTLEWGTPNPYLYYPQGSQQCIVQCAAEIRTDFTRRNPDAEFRKFRNDQGIWYLVEYEIEITFPALVVSVFFRGERVRDVTSKVRVQ